MKKYENRECNCEKTNNKAKREDNYYEHDKRKKCSYCEEEDYYEVDCCCKHKYKCDCCHCCVGPAGPEGPEGPEGPAGPAGPAGNCCCSDSVIYALDTIYNAYPKDENGDPNPDPSNSEQYVSLYLFNQKQLGVIQGYSTNKKVVHLQKQSGQGNVTNNYVSLCNVMYISFNLSPVDFKNIDCETPECCCNQDVEEILKQLIPYGTNPKLPIETDISINMVENNNSSINITTVYGICNGILWGEVKGTINGDSYIAVPLCNVYNMESGAITPTDSTLEKRVTVLEEQMVSMEDRVKKLEQN